MNMLKHRLVWSTCTMIAVWGILGFSDAWACPACGCGGTTFVDRAKDPNAHTIYAQFQATSRGEQFGAGHPWTLREWRTDLTVGWSHKRIALTARVPWLWRTITYKGFQTDKTVGLGDIEVAAAYTLTKLPDADTPRNNAGTPLGWWAGVHLGLSIPTGQLAVDNEGQPVMDDVQSGTGAFMPFGGFFWSVGLKGWKVDGRHTLYVPTSSRFWFQVGPTLQQRVRLMAQPLKQFQFGFGFYAAWAAPVTVHGEPDDDSGGFEGYLDLEAEIRPIDNLTFVIGGRFPVIQRLRGDHRAQMGMFLAVRFQQPIVRKTAPQPMIF